MNIVFFGSSKFAVPALRALIEAGHKIVCVVTQPDRRKGRGLHIEPTEIKKIAKESGLKVYQPQIINSAEPVKLLKALNPDLFVVIAYGQILSEEVLSIPKVFAINAHASLLPKYRGAAPINYSIINGDTQTGVTVIKVIREMDAGPVIMQKEIAISDNDTVVSLEEKLSKLAAQLTVESLQLIAAGRQKLTIQDKSRVSFAPKLKKDNGLINWGRPARDIVNLIKGCFNWPGAFTHYKGKMLKIYTAGVRGQGPGARGLPGEIIGIDKHEMIVATGKDSLVIRELQIEGKRRMTAQEFIAGHKVRIGEILAG